MSIDTETIFKYKQEIAKLLAERPELIPLQTEITERLNKAGSTNNRLIVMREMLIKSTAELHNALLSLVKVKI